MQDKKRNLGVEAELHDLGPEEQSLEKIVVSGDHCDHVDIAPALCKTVQGFLEINVG